MAGVDASYDNRHSYYSILNVPKDANDEQIKRAYRSLAQSLHPDKHTDEELREKAQDAFRRLQEAYDVLRDPQKRAVYDIYGSEGLTAGLQVGSKLDGPEELRRKWEEFKAQQAKDSEDARVGHRAYYMCMLDAVKFVRGDIRSVPVPRIIVVQNSVAVPITNADTVSLQGSAALRSQAGQGSVIAGYERTITPRDTVSAQVVLGLQSLVSLTSTRQLGQYTSAALTATYNPSQGMGLQLSSTRQVAVNTSAQFAWVVGPAAASGMVLSVTHKGRRYIVVAKLEVGMVTSVSLRLTWLLNKAAEVRLMGRAALSGLEGEVGVARRLAGSSTTYCACTVNRTGVLAKVRYSRVNQTYEFPIRVSDDYTDWKVLVCTTLGPPAAGLLVLRYILRPWTRWRARVTLEQQQKEQAEELQQRYNKAAAEAALLAPVAARTAAAEAEKGGLVLLVAVYGALDGWQEVLQQRARLELQAAEVKQQLDQQQARDQQLLNGSHPPSSPGVPSTMPAAAAVQTSSSTSTEQSSEQQQPKQQGSPAAAGIVADINTSSSSIASSSQVLQPWVDVTCALQYLVRESALQLHGGISKVGLMGFADVALERPRQLYVAYALNRQLYQAQIDDLDMLKVPGAGQVVEDLQLRRWLEQQLLAAGRTLGSAKPSS